MIAEGTYCLVVRGTDGERIALPVGIPDSKDQYCILVRGTDGVPCAVALTPVRSKDRLAILTRGTDGYRVPLGPVLLCNDCQWAETYNFVFDVIPHAGPMACGTTFQDFFLDWLGAEAGIDLTRVTEGVQPYMCEWRTYTGDPDAEVFESEDVCHYPEIDPWRYSFPPVGRLRWYRGRFEFIGKALYPQPLTEAPFGEAQSWNWLWTQRTYHQWYVKLVWDYALTGSGYCVEGPKGTLKVTNSDGDPDFVPDFYLYRNSFGLLEIRDVEIT